MLVSGSIFAVNDNYLEYAYQLKNAQCDYLHIDLFQNKNNYKISDILLFDKTYLPLDIHLIYESVTDEVIEILNKSNAEIVTLQFENLLNKDIIESISRKLKSDLGIAITAKTDIADIEKYINNVNHILFMCSEPGVTGAQFNETCFEKIKQIKISYPNLKIYADGGIELEIAKKMNSLGVTLVVSGSYLAKNINKLDKNIYNLKFSNEKNISVIRNMIRTNKLPVLSKQSSFIEIVNIINKGRMGIGFIVENDHLAGIITDGDIRRAFLRYEKDVFNISAKDIMNNSPFIIQSDLNMDELFKKLSLSRKGIEVVPIVKDDVFVGAIDLSIGY